MQLIGNLASALVKLLYAFVWQEHTLDIPFVLEPEANIRGNELIPVVNAFANMLNDFSLYEQNFQVHQVLLRLAISLSELERYH